MERAGSGSHAQPLHLVPATSSDQHSSDQQPAPPGAHLCDELAARKGPRRKEPVACRRDVAAADVDAAADHGERRRGRHLGVRRRRCGRVSGARGCVQCACALAAAAATWCAGCGERPRDGRGSARCRVAVWMRSAAAQGCGRARGRWSSGKSRADSPKRGFRRVLSSARASNGYLYYVYAAAAGGGGLEAPAQRALRRWSTRFHIASNFGAPAGGLAAPRHLLTQRFNKAKQPATLSATGTPTRTRALANGLPAPRCRAAAHPPVTAAVLSCFHRRCRRRRRSCRSLALALVIRQVTPRVALRRAQVARDEQVADLPVEMRCMAFEMQGLQGVL